MIEVKELNKIDSVCIFKIECSLKINYDLRSISMCFFKRMMYLAHSCTADLLHATVKIIIFSVVCISHYLLELYLILSL